jgi:ABC-type transport system substrate-binding protein
MCPPEAVRGKEMSYWTGVLEKRLSRRRSLAATSAGALGAAFLAACGGGDSAGSGGEKTSGLLLTPADTSKQAKAGGTIVTSVNADVLTLDPLTNSSSIDIQQMLPVYSPFTKFGLGTFAKMPGVEDITGDIVESWELSPDATQITMKLRPNQKFDPRPPTNGRAATTADVQWSWDRFASLSPFRGDVLNSLNEAGPILGVTTPDDRTIVMKMAFPYSPIIELLAFHSYFLLMPKEAEDKFNAKSEMRGTGPFRLDTYTPNVSFEYKKNPDWYIKERPFLDGMTRSIIPDYSQGLAQFETGTLWSYADLRQEDVLRVKRDHPRMNLTRSLAHLKTPQAGYYTASARPESPLRDVRVRRAASMLLDRDLFIDTIGDLKKFEAAGLPIEKLWNSHLYAGQPNWLDPKGKEIGEGGQYFQYNPTEAKKLISAAGHQVVQIPFNWHNRGVNRRAEVISGMLQDSGLFKLDIKLLDYNTEWRDAQRSKGYGFLGFCSFTNGGHNEEAWFVNMYTPNGKFAINTQPIPNITDYVVKTRTEIDNNKRAERVKQLQKDLAMLQEPLMDPGYSVEFALSQPWLKNFGVFSTGGQGQPSSTSRDYTQFWYDPAEKNKA